jgi:dienelactone hydrolase
MICPTGSTIRAVFTAVGLALLLAACAETHHPRAVPAAAPPRLTFGYDRAAPLRYADRGVVKRDGSVDVRDVSFASGRHRVSGYLVERPGTKRRPGVVLVHGSGGDRRELLAKAVTLARRGLVALTITEPSTADPPPAATSVRTALAQARSLTVDDVVAVRRAADVLTSLPQVDAQRLGYLGWSAGAKTGTFVAASDRRFRALALLSAGADKLSAFVAAAPPSFRALVRRQLGSVDPLRYIALARPGTLRLEDGSRDAVVPHRALANMIAAAPARTSVGWYPAGHALNERAYSAAFGWLVTKLRR